MNMPKPLQELIQDVVSTIWQKQNVIRYRQTLAGLTDREIATMVLNTNNFPFGSAMWCLMSEVVGRMTQRNIPSHEELVTCYERWKGTPFDGEHPEGGLPIQNRATFPLPCGCEKAGEPRDDAARLEQRMADYAIQAAFGRAMFEPLLKGLSDREIAALLMQHNMEGVGSPRWVLIAEAIRRMAPNMTPDELGAVGQRMAGTPFDPAPILDAAFDTECACATE
jgi:hypothetical protein